MKKYINSIVKEFSNELNLLIFLSQEDLKSQEYKGDLNKINWGGFLELTLKHRMVSHVLKHSTFLAEFIPISTYEKLIDYRITHSKKSLNYAIHAIRIYQKFTENNIPHCFFKGPLLSLELYNDIGYRSFRDIDILVRKEDVENAKALIEELNFECIYPKKDLTKKQKRINYTISHHYHFVHPAQRIDVELHWNMTNPKSFFGVDSNDIILNSRKWKVSKYEIPYISKPENIIYQAAHGSIHQWYRLFWLKDFSELITKANPSEIEAAYELSKKLKLSKPFLQACMLSQILFSTKFPENFDLRFTQSLITTPLKSIKVTDLSQQGIKGKVRFVFYKLSLKRDLKYYLNLIYRLRTHLSDWEILNLSDSLFFLYYVFRPFLLIYKFLIKR